MEMSVSPSSAIAFLAYLVLCAASFWIAAPVLKGHIDMVMDDVDGPMNAGVQVAFAIACFFILGMMILGA